MALMLLLSVTVEYKMEVLDAIPYNASIMQRMGLNL